MTDKGRFSISQGMLPQPPPNAKAPPPSEAALLSQKKWKWLWFVGLFSIVVLAAAPLLVRQSKCRDWGPPELSNLRQIGFALFEFEAEYGKFPDAITAIEVREKTGTPLPLGSRASNDFFRQLIAAGIATSETMFYARTEGCRKPDQVIDAVHALAKGECGFTYFLGATDLSNPGRPLVVAPMIPGTDRFDPKPFKGKAIILRLDNSASSLSIDKDGHVIAHGENLMNPSNPIWDGHPPVIAWPE